MTSRRYGNSLTASKQGACTAQTVRAATRLIEGNVSRHKHNMLSLFYATSLKLLVFFVVGNADSNRCNMQQMAQKSVNLAI